MLAVRRTGTEQPPDAPLGPLEEMVGSLSSQSSAIGSGSGAPVPMMNV